MPGEEAPLRVSAEPVVQEDELPRSPVPRAPEVAGRRVYIRRDKELAKYGYTPGCPGCVVAQAGGRPQSHSFECRDRIQGRMEEDEEGKQRLTEAVLRRSSLGVRGVPPQEEAVRPVAQQAEVRKAPPSGQAGAGERADPPRAEEVLQPGGMVVDQDGPGSKKQKIGHPGEDEVMSLVAEVGRWTGAWPAERASHENESVFTFGPLPSQYGAVPASLVVDLSLGWSLYDPEERKSVRSWLDTARPQLVVGSRAGVRVDTPREVPDRGERVKFLVETYERQIESGRYFLHGLTGETAMEAAGVEALIGRDRVETVEHGKDGRYITNAAEIARALRERGPGGENGQVLRGMLIQMQSDANERDGRLQVGSMDIGAHVDE